MCLSQAGPPKEILQGGTRLFWGPVDRLRPLSNLRIWVENTTKKKSKNLNKTCITKVMGPFRDSRAPSWLAGPRTDVPTESPSQARTWISNVIYRYGFFHGSRWDVIAHFVDIGGILNITFQKLGLTTQHTVKVLYLVTVLFSWSVTVIFCFRFLSERDDYIRIYGVSFRIICLEMRSVSLLTDFSNDIFIIKYSNACIGEKEQYSSLIHVWCMTCWKLIVLHKLLQQIAVIITFKILIMLWWSRRI